MSKASWTLAILSFLLASHMVMTMWAQHVHEGQMQHFLGYMQQMCRNTSTTPVERAECER